MTPVELPESVFPRSLADSLAASLPSQCRESQDSEYVTNTRSLANPPGTRPLLIDALPHVEAAAGLSLYPVCTFLREYGERAELKEHCDREGLDWTVSLTLESDVEWPLEVLEEDGEWTGLAPWGSRGVLVAGRTVRHRRRVYNGNRNLTLLLHYAEAPSPEFPGLPTFMRVPRMLPAGHIERIYSQLDASRMIRGTVSEGGLKAEDRSGSIAWLRRPGWQWLHDDIRSSAAYVNERVWRFDVRGTTQDEIQFCRYERGQAYHWHVDRGAVKSNAMNARTLSVVVALRHAEKGGGIEMRRGGWIDLSPGEGLVFPSTEEHRAMPVEAGTRESLVLWLSGSAR